MGRRWQWYSRFFYVKVDHGFVLGASSRWSHWEMDIILLVLSLAVLWSVCLLRSTRKLDDSTYGAMSVFLAAWFDSGYMLIVSSGGLWIISHIS